MSLWMRDMPREDISTRNGRDDGPSAPKFVDFQCNCLLSWRTAAPCLWHVYGTYFKMEAFLAK